MEVYYKDLISDSEVVEKLVDDLALLVQGAEALAKADGVELTGNGEEELSHRLELLKAGYRRIHEQTLAGARATDRFVRDHPYSTIGCAFAVGLLAGYLVNRRGAGLSN